MTIFDKKVVISATLAGLLTFGVCTYIQHEKQQVDWVHCSLEASIDAGELWEKVSYCEGEIIHTRHNTVSWGSTESEYTVLHRQMGTKEEYESYVKSNNICTYFDGKYYINLCSDTLDKN